MYKFKKGQEDSQIQLPGGHLTITADNLANAKVQALIHKTDWLRSIFDFKEQSIAEENLEQLEELEHEDEQSEDLDDNDSDQSDEDKADDTAESNQGRKTKKRKK